MSKFKKDYIISDRYKIQHFIEDRLYCENYTAEDLSTSKMVSIAIYNASKIAREEFPNYDVTVRGAISIGRRLADPLAELVKIDAKSIGVGQYQHEFDQ